MQSLMIAMKFGNQTISTGTAFVVESPNKPPLLITNRHNFTGRDQKTNDLLSKTGGIPDCIEILHNKGNSGHRGWISKIEPLFDPDEKPLWFEHPKWGKDADFVALKLTQTEGIDLCSYSVEAVNSENELFILPSHPVSIIGFPFGENGGGGLGIWVNGYVASEPDLHWDDLPVFLVDRRARPGQSGSPVIACRTKVSTIYDKVKFNGITHAQLLGIYSGRINPDSDLGMVWKTSAIRELVESVY
ncbi:MAG TPA: serine protease [Rhodobiaceae bacterium]|nr:serine protease [Rhodobiaceae bacterium]